MLRRTAQWDYFWHTIVTIVTVTKLRWKMGPNSSLKISPMIQFATTQTHGQSFAETQNGQFAFTISSQPLQPNG